MSTTDQMIAADLVMYGREARERIPTLESLLETLGAGPRRANVDLSIIAASRVYAHRIARMAGASVLIAWVAVMVAAYGTTTMDEIGENHMGFVKFAVFDWMAVAPWFLALKLTGVTAIAYRVGLRWGRRRFDATILAAADPYDRADRLVRSIERPSLMLTWCGLAAASVLYALIDRFVLVRLRVVGWWSDDALTSADWAPATYQLVAIILGITSAAALLLAWRWRGWTTRATDGLVLALGAGGLSLVPTSDAHAYALVITASTFLLSTGLVLGTRRRDAAVLGEFQ